MHAQGSTMVSGLAGRTTALMALFTVVIGVAVAGCASGLTTCTVRHHFAIAIFQNGLGNPRTRYVTSFTLTVRYPGGGVSSRRLFTRITLKAADGGNPPIRVKTYRVGRAESCSIGHVRAHRGP